MNLRAILIDREEDAMNLLESQLNLFGYIDIIGKYKNPLEGARAVKEKIADIVFMDIHMPGIHNISLVQGLIDANPELNIVFVTSHREYVLDAFDLGVLDYVMKPTSMKRLENTLNRI